MRIDAVDGDTVEIRILKFGSDPTILAGVTRGPQNDHSKFVFHDLLQFMYVNLGASIHYYIIMFMRMYYNCIKELVCTTFI